MSSSGEHQFETLPPKDRDDKIKIARERQNEERQRKIEELKAQAEAAQRYREQKEEERRRRIDDIRNRELEKKTQVDERKRAIMEAEKERREYIMRKNMERESRLESKKRDKNLSGFAFGSSTPRLLESSDFGMVSPSTFWSHRRSTSISNVAFSRRSTERDLPDSNSKKRALSANGTDRQEDDTSNQIIFRSVARRKTDLMPTVPSPRETLFGSRYSLSNTPKTSASRSGNVTPGGNFSSRPGSSLSTSTHTSGVVPRRSAQTVRKPRPASIAGTGVSTEEINKLKFDVKPPINSTSKRHSALMSSSMIMTSSFSKSFSNDKRTPTKKGSIPLSPKTLSKSDSTERLNKSSKQKEVNKSMSKSSITLSNSVLTQKSSTKSPNTNLNVGNTRDTKPSASLISNVHANNISNNTNKTNNSSNNVENNIIIEKTNLIEDVTQGEQTLQDTIPSDTMSVPMIAKSKITTEEEAKAASPIPCDTMSASMIAKSKITTEEEAKAALAERRKAAREEADRQAELEKQRKEAERLELLRQEEEEFERQRKFEEEALRLAEEQRHAEEKRLQLAIEEARQRDEEERLKREEDERQRNEREELDKKAKEEAEKQKQEVAERLKREEKEREERRKRVEAIMSRTRKAGAPANTSVTTPVKESEPQTKESANMEDQKVITPSDSEPQNSQAMYEQSVIDKDFTVVNNFSNMIIEENEKNLKQQPLKNVNIISESNNSLKNTASNGNTHNNIVNTSENILFQEVLTQDSINLVDAGNESQEVNTAIHFNNNNSILTTLVSSESHNENKDIPLL